MNWNDTIQQLAKTHWSPRPNLVQIAGDKLLPFVEAVKKIDERAEYNSMGQRKPVAGYRFFHCPDCENYWREKSRDCKSPSNESCPKCGELSHPFNDEQHPEWPLDKLENPT